MKPDSGATDEVLQSLEEVKRLHVEEVVRACHGNQTEAARRLGINRKTVARFVTTK